MADADLVFEGGGVKGAGLAGALAALSEWSDPYTFHRVAGTSAGAIVSSMLAAGMTPAELKDLMFALDFSQFEDESRVFKHFKRFGEGFGLIFHEGMFEGEFLHEWIRQNLAAKNVHTWGDLKDEDPHSSLPPERQYKLVVVVSDVSRGRMLRLPWDFKEFLGVDPDTQPVADAVRASASIPFFFRPFHMPANPDATGGHDEILCTDGGMLSNYPIDIFDRTDGAPPRWPTLGIKLSARSTPAEGDWNPAANGFDLAKSLIATMQNAHDRVHVDDERFSSRTVFVDTLGYKATDFGLTTADKQILFDSGKTAGTGFLKSWDWEAWKAKYSSTPPQSQP